MKPGWPRKLAAVAVFLLLALALGHFLGLPEAIPTKSEEPWFARQGETMTLHGAQGPLLSVEGAAGGSAAVHAEQAALDAGTVSALAELGIAAPAGPGALSWIAQGGGDGRAAISVRASGDRPGAVALRPPADDLDPELRLTAVKGALLVEAVVPVGGAAGQGAELRAGGDLLMKSDFGALPVGIVVPEGRTVSIDIGGGPARIRLGDPDSAELALTALGVRRNRGGVRHFACGAEEGAIAWVERDPARMRCADSLSATGLRAGEDGIQLRLIGSGFLMRDGETVISSWYERAGRNPLIAAFLLLLYGGLAGWLYRELFGARRAPKPAGKTTARRRARRS